MLLVHIYLRSSSVQRSTTIATTTIIPLLVCHLSSHRGSYVTVDTSFILTLMYARSLLLTTSRVVHSVAKNKRTSIRPQENVEYFSQHSSLDEEDLPTSLASLRFPNHTTPCQRAMRARPLMGTEKEE